MRSGTAKGTSSVDAGIDRDESHWLLSARFMKRDVHSPALQDCSGAIANLRDAFLFGAVGATVDSTVFFHSVTDHMRAAMRASRSERLDCTFKAVEDVTLAVQCHLERFVVVIATSFAYRHGRPLKPKFVSRRNPRRHGPVPQGPYAPVLGVGPIGF